jgi:hypothetical protein
MDRCARCSKPINRALDLFFLHFDSPDLETLFDCEPELLCRRCSEDLTDDMSYLSMLEDFGVDRDIQEDMLKHYQLNRIIH